MEEKNTEKTEVIKENTAKESQTITIKIEEYKQLIKDSLLNSSYNQNQNHIKEKNSNPIIFVEENKEEEKKEKKPFFNFSKRGK